VVVLQVRLAGDRYVLVEYGPMELDLNLRVRIWALQAHLAAAKVRPVRMPTMAAPVSQIVQMPGVNVSHTHGQDCSSSGSPGWISCQQAFVL
jgi:hypothetical protein